MKIGDRVRFLNDVGGGKITGFQKGNIVLVEDEDGFDIPVLASEVVVITTDDYNIAKVDTMERKSPKEEAPVAPKVIVSDDVEIDPADREITYKPKPEERADGERLNVILAFVPTDISNFSQTTFECYLINDCNYYIDYAYMSQENAAYKMRSHGVVEPNTKVFIEEVNHAMLNDLERVAFQLFAYKEDKPFLPKPSIHAEIRIDTTKFFKFHTFREGLFFDEPTLEFAIVKDDKAVRPLRVDSQELREAMIAKREQRREHPQKARVSKKSNVKEIIEVDLHAHELLETTAGMSAGDIKEYQMSVVRKTLNSHLKDKGRKIVFIHGKGDGVLRNAIISELKHKYKQCSFQDASFQQYGFGATMVTIH